MFMYHCPACNAMGTKTVLMNHKSGALNFCHKCGSTSTSPPQAHHTADQIMALMGNMGAIQAEMLIYPEVVAIKLLQGDVPYMYRFIWGKQKVQNLELLNDLINKLHGRVPAHKVPPMAVLTLEAAGLRVDHGGRSFFWMNNRLLGLDEMVVLNVRGNSRILYDNVLTAGG